MILQIYQNNLASLLLSKNNHLHFLHSDCNVNFMFMTSITFIRGLMMTLSIRSLQEEDIPNIVNYWFKNTDENLVRMGVAKSKLTSEIEITQSLKTVCHTPLEKTRSHYMIWFIDDKPVGYNALKDIVQGEIAHMHLHMWNADYRGKGYGAKLFCMAALEFYRMFHLKMILCEPRSSNPMPNKMLTKIGFKKWKTYISTSSELSETCELNSYIIDVATATDFLAKTVK